MIALAWLLACIHPADWDTRQPHWVDVDAEGNEVCAVRDDGTARCWGTAFDDGTLDFTDLASVEMGVDNACFLVDNGDALCIGGIFEAFSSVDGPFDGLTVAPDGACGWSSEGVTCWGTDRYDSRVALLPVNLRDLTVGDDVVCGVDDLGQVHCPRFEDGKPIADARVPGLAGIDVVSVTSTPDGSGHCFFDGEGGVWCATSRFVIDNDDWSFTAYDGVVEGDLLFDSEGSIAPCGLDDARRVACLGDYDDELDPLPTGTFDKVVLGGDALIPRGCGLTSDGYLVPWSNLELICGEDCQRGYAE